MWIFRLSRASKVTAVGANRKRLCDFLLVRNSNFGPILHRFWARTRFMCSWPHPYSTLILGVFPLPMLGINERMDLRLYGREIIFGEFKPMWSWYLIVTDGRTDRQTDRRLTVASPRSALASRGKNKRLELLLLVLLLLLFIIIIIISIINIISTRKSDVKIIVRLENVKVGQQITIWLLCMWKTTSLMTVFFYDCRGRTDVSILTQCTARHLHSCPDPEAVPNKPLPVGPGWRF